MVTTNIIALCCLFMTLCTDLTLGDDEIHIPECTSTTCQTIPQNCNGTSDCTAIATWSDEKTHIKVTLWAKGSPSYVAMGINPKTNTMSPSNNFECVRTANGSFKVGNSINPVVEGRHPNNDLENEYNAGISDEEVNFEDGILSCVFNRAKTVEHKDLKEYSLDDGKKYYILLAYGNLKDDGRKGKHAGRIASTDMKTLMADNSATSPKMTHTMSIISTMFAMYPVWLLSQM